MALHTAEIGRSSVLGFSEADNPAQVRAFVAVIATLGGCKPCSDRNEEKASEAHLISHDLWGNLSLCGWREQRVGELTLRER